MSPTLSLGSLENIKTSKQSEEISLVNTTNLGGVASYELVRSTQNEGNIGEGLREKLVYIDFEREILEILSKTNHCLQSVVFTWFHVGFTCFSLVRVYSVHLCHAAKPWACVA